MMHDPPDRLWDLLADRATVGLSPAEEGELHALLAAHPDVHPDELETLVALLEQGQPAPEARLPDDLARAIESESRRLPQFSHAVPSALVPPRSSWPAWTGWAGWLVAAASLLALLGLWYAQRPTADLPPSLARERLLSEPGSRLIASQPTPGRPGIGGDVAWNNDRQQGYLRLTGFPVNDPATRQYQLWIIDGSRNERFPVDGGIFNVTSDSEAIIPIRAHLRIGNPLAFVVTREPAGGVVVSSREEIFLIAAVTP